MTFTSTSPSFSSIPTLNDDISWDAATVNWGANGYRLPTEMEYMWAAMGATNDAIASDLAGGVNTRGYLKGYAGSTETAGGQVNIGNYAWYSENSGSTSHPVGNKTANELGLYDLSGDVWEWNWDAYGYWPIGAVTDYRGVGGHLNRVYHGGSWYYGASLAAVAYQGGFKPYGTNLTTGFRVVRP